MSENFLDYYSTQAFSHQTGDGMSFYQGRRFVPMVNQEGEGLGSLFSLAKPLFVGVAKNLGRRALNAGVGIVNGVLNGQSLKDAAKENALEQGRGMMNDVIGKVGSATRSDRNLKRSTNSPRSKKVKKGRVSKKQPHKRSIFS
jgi:hypothetical protein